MKRILVLTICGFVLWSCNSEKKNTNKSSEGTKTAVSSNTAFDCLKKFEDDYSLLLTKEDIASVYNLDFAQAKQELRSGSYGEHIYQWASDRPDLTMEISGMKMQLPDENTLGIKNFVFNENQNNLESAISFFDMGYKKLSEQELEKIQDNLDKQNDAIKETGKKLMEVREQRSWDFVEDLGSSAWYKWSANYGGELVVMAGKSKFTIISKVSEDPMENRDIAEKLAQKVLNKCK